MSTLRGKSVHELRSIAQSFGVADIFSKDAAHLIQDIELKQQALAPPPIPPIPKPEYDARLMDAEPAQRSLPTEAVEVLRNHIARGLIFAMDEIAESWTMQFSKKTDSGTLRMPLRDLVRCADGVMR